MADTDIVQVIAGARIDAQSLSNFMFKPANVMVSRRLAPDIFSFNHYLEYFDGLKAVYEQPSGNVTINGKIRKTVAQIAIDAADTVNAAIEASTVDGSLVTDALTKTVAPAGGISRNQKAKNDERLSVKDFGAKGDGLADDTLAIRSAVAAAPQGATIYLPRGVYRITSTIPWRTKLSLKGDGIGASIIKMDGYNFSAIEHTSSGSTGGGDPLVTPLEDCHFEDFEIDGSGLTDTRSTPMGKGLFIIYMKRAIFRNLYIHHTIGTGLGCDFLEETVIDSVVAEYCGRNFAAGGIGQSGIGIGTGWKEQESVRITNCHTNYNGNFGIFVEIQVGTQTYRAQGATFANCYAKGNLVGFSNKGSGGTNFLNCHATNNTEDGFRITSSRYSYNMIVGCRSEFNGSHGYYSNNTSAYDMISDSVAIGNALDGLYVTSSGGQGEMFPDGLGVNVSNLTSSDNAGCGIFISPSLATIQGSYTLKDCLVKNNGSAGLKTQKLRDVVVSGGIFESNGDEGVSIRSILANGLVKIHDVVSRYNGSEGIIAASSADGEFISIKNSLVLSNCQSLTTGKRAGIAVESRSGEVVVKGNASKNAGDGTTQLEGIRLFLANATSSAQITDNIINNNEVNPFSVGGLGEYIVRRNVGYNYAEAIVTTVGESGSEQPKRNFDYNFYISGTDISISVNGALLVRDATTACVFVPANAAVVVTYTTKGTAFIQRL
ncbi:right-handed parallel beta-helix repeat-containing protein [Psychrobacter faecalis]|uniref:right-handed parallel beta-helix repeat-containing protein n=1 Tax=Psychrobacter faecalis TaxID=180588 RepID=UPI003FD533FC